MLDKIGFLARLLTPNSRSTANDFDKPRKIFLSEFRQPLLEKPPLWFLPSQTEGFFVRIASFFAVSYPSAKIGPGRMGQMVIVEFAPSHDPIDQFHACSRAVAHCDCHRPIQLDNWRRLRAQQQIV